MITKLYSAGHWMKLVFNLLFFLCSLYLLEDKSFSLSEKQIKKICKREKRESTCIENLKEKKSNLQKGILIEIPIIPFKN